MNQNWNKKLGYHIWKFQNKFVLELFLKLAIKKNSLTLR